MSEAVAVRQEDPKTFPGMLVAFKAQIAAALPKHINPDRMARIALTCFRLNPALARCQPASVFAAVIQSAQLGLEPGLNGRAYLIPYKDECQFIPGWKGLVELANRTGRCSVWTGAVFDGDEFDYQLGDNPHVTHRPGSEDDPDKLLYVYAVGRIRGNEYPVIEVWPIDKVRKHFKRYNKVGAKHYAHGNWEMYARKIPLLQVLKYMPASPELESAIAMSDVAEGGHSQGLNIRDAIEGTFAPPPVLAEASGVSEAEAITMPTAKEPEAAKIDTSTGEITTAEPQQAEEPKAEEPKAEAKPEQAQQRVASEAQRRVILARAAARQMTDRELDAALGERFAFTLATMPAAMVNDVLGFLQGK